jgi:tRNA nucleotidyltransferase (CCA-adding enzyme)
MIKTYLVGGAVRDQLLNIPIKDKDYVVVGSHPEAMIKQGFKPVGKDFPVFLHPKTHEEYALARTEKKVGRGYHGFEFYALPDVTLEEDLQRRDITINAIAQDEEGQFIDPFGGMDDVKHKIIRHVSDAFEEDPLRVLRVARFQAKLPEFSIDPATQKLLQKIVANDEIQSLSSERMIEEIKKGLAEKGAALMFEVLNTCGALDVIMPDANYNEYQAYLEALCKLDAFQNIDLDDRLSLVLMLLYFDYGTFKNSLDKTIKKLKINSRQSNVINHIKKSFQDLIHIHDLNDESSFDLINQFDFFRRPEITYAVLDYVNLLSHALVLKNSGVGQFKQHLHLFEKKLKQQPSLNDDSLQGKALGDKIKQMRFELFKQA